MLSLRFSNGFIQRGYGINHKKVVIFLPEGIVDGGTELTPGCKMLLLKGLNRKTFEATKVLKGPETGLLSVPSSPFHRNSPEKSSLLQVRDERRKIALLEKVGMVSIKLV